MARLRAKKTTNENCNHRATTVQNFLHVQPAHICTCRHMYIFGTTAVAKGCVFFTFCAGLWFYCFETERNTKFTHATWHGMFTLLLLYLCWSLLVMALVDFIFARTNV